MRLRQVIWGTLLALSLAGSHARAEGTDDAKAHYERGLAAYALNNYPEAAAEYEAAFKLKPDSALLYNAAQAHRLAGNYQRALQLYTSYLNLFGAKAPNKAEVQRHIANLKQALESQQKAQTTPPVVPRPVGNGPDDGKPSTVGTAPTGTATAKPTQPKTEPVVATRPVEPKPVVVATRPAEPKPEPRPTLVEPNLGTAPTTTTTTSSSDASLTATAPEKKPIYKKGWFWGAVVGGVVVVGLAVGLGVGLSGPSAPTPTFGMTVAR